MFRHRSYQMDVVPEAGGGSSLADLVVPEHITTKQDLEKAISDLYGRANELNKRGEVAPGSPERDNLDKQVADLKAEMAKMQERVANATRTVPGDEPDSFSGIKNLVQRLDPPRGMNRLHHNLVALTPNEMSYAGSYGDHINVVAGGGDKFVNKFGLSDAWRSKVVELQALNDLILLTDLCMTGDGNTEYAHRGENRTQRIKTLKLYKDWEAISKDFQRAGVLDTATSTEGLEWVPTMWSSQLIPIIQANLVVANLFSKTIMPAQSYVLPVHGVDNVAYRIAEAIDDPAVTTATWSSGNTVSTTIGSLFATNKCTLTAVKLAARMMASSEILEDSIINMAPLMTTQLGKAVARAIDDAIMNGSTTATHEDFDIGAMTAANSTDRRRSWNGLRKLALGAGAKVDKVTLSVAGQPIRIDQLMSVKGQMGAYGAIPSQGAWITGFNSLIDFMLARDSSGSSTAGGIQVFLTMEKFPNAVNLTGQIGFALGSPVVLSEFSREDVSATGFNTTGGPNTTRSIIYVNREAFTLGERRAMTITRSAERFIETDQLIFVGTWRGDFEPYYGTAAKAAGILYDII